MIRIAYSSGASTLRGPKAVLAVLAAVAGLLLAAVAALFAALPAVLADGGRLVIYGPFRRGGRHTSDSNAAFDAALRERDPASGVRDLEWVDGLARAAGLRLVEDRAMPANNRGLVWRRQPA